ncbi:MAG: AAA family ATPase [Bacteroidales bacterium]|nr:AAA family ATPase [Bacteroidales bacterium]
MKTSICFITGDQGVGKTTFVKKLAALLITSGYECGGFYAEGYWKNGIRDGFDIVEINGLKRERLCNTVSEVNDEQFHRFFFKQKGMELGYQILKTSEGKQAIVFIDEVGGFELNGKGWAEAIFRLLHNPPSIMILAVRTSFEQAVTEKFEADPINCWDVNQVSPELAFQQLLSTLNKT